ncbi:MAG TPA: hypothetical protein PKA90_08905 [Ignavibacteria bacterium]|nr:hypothetical protein [Ignavibacteria bacterium]HMR40536.1 hypothetical protein [Ignavibacteria bacterium]
MSDTNPNSEDKKTSDNNETGNDSESKYEFITSFIDDEIKDPQEKMKAEELINSNNDFYNRYISEKYIKEKLKSSIPQIETPVYLYKNIGEQIDKYIKKSTIQKPEIPHSMMQANDLSKSHLKRNLLYASFAFVALILFSLFLNSYLQKNPDFQENDLVAVSRKVYDKVVDGKTELHFKSGDPKQLTDTMNKYLDFKVFIPDVKDAVLIGGDCEELNGEMIAHFVHKKGNIIIYTLQADKQEVLNNLDKIILQDNFKENVKSGKNWFPCSKEPHKTAVVWYKDNVICSSVADMEPKEISVVLTNYK